MHTLHVAARTDHNRTLGNHPGGEEEKPPYQHIHAHANALSGDRLPEVT